MHDQKIVLPSNEQDALLNCINSYVEWKSYY